MSLRTSQPRHRSRRHHACTVLALAACAFASTAAIAARPTLPDRDGDSVPDLLDNCVFVANADQRDSNDNGFGDRCDADINGDGRVNALDLALLRQQFGRSGGSADLNGDGAVNALDLALLRVRFGQAPGPQGDLLARVRAMNTTPQPPEFDQDPAPLPTEAGSPALLLPQALAAIDTVPVGTSKALAAALARARDGIDDALAALNEGSGDGSLAYLGDSMFALERGHTALMDALALDPGSGVLIALLLPAVQSAREAARHTGQALIDRLVAAGVSSSRLQLPLMHLRNGEAQLVAGNFGPAMSSFALAVADGTPLLVFSLDRMEQNLRAVFDAQSVGWAYAISGGGLLLRNGSNGVARTSADAPATLQSSTKPMHVASTSKTLTGIVALRLLADLGLNSDEPIGPWLPSNWPRGAGVNALTFENLMTHRSGFDQNGVAGNDYASLRDVVALAVGSQGYAYNNANFGMLRVLVAGLMGIDPADFGEFDSGVLTASAFLLRAQQLYSNVGVPFSCSSQVSNPTRQYLFPDGGGPGYAEPDRSLTCGGYGVNISAQNLARTLTFWRYTTDLLPVAMRNRMRNHHLGLMDPANFGWATGAFGTYHGHGGDWDHGAGGLDSCMYAFPNLYEVAVVVNSSRKTSGGYTPVSHQCSVLKWAFENAWLPS